MMYRINKKAEGLLSIYTVVVAKDTRAYNVVVPILHTAMILM